MTMADALQKKQAAFSFERQCYMLIMRRLPFLRKWDLQESQHKNGKNEARKYIPTTTACKWKFSGCYELSPEPFYSGGKLTYRSNFVQIIGSKRSFGKFLASRRSQTSRDTKMAFDIHIAMYLGYISSKGQLSSSTSLSSRLCPAKRPEKPAA